jgi:Na+-translocating ferredoxin:NAD+ oxidoreductase RnfC subunit
MEIADRARDAGVVGAGGAGFPTHVKLAARADIVIANGAECEPLLECDQAVMSSRAGEVVAGLHLAMQATGASRGIIAVKGEHRAAVAALQRAVDDASRRPQEAPGGRPAGDPDCRLHLLEAVYPAGDEFVLAYETTGRLVPEGGIPPSVGVVVQNVGTLANLAAAYRGQPVTHRWLTVAGEVNEPRTAQVPVGAPIGDVIAFAGGLRGADKRAARLQEAAISAQGDLAVVVGGPMMGKVVGDLREPVTRTTSGIVVLKRGSTVIRNLTTPIGNWVRRGRSTCDQCRDCTELCPRYLLGHSLQPHEVMRSVNYGLTDKPEIVTRAVLCCECRLCEAFACPLELSPMAYYRTIKQELAAQGWRNTRHRRGDLTPVATRPYRLIPTHRLVEHLGLGEYAAKGAPLDSRPLAPRRVTIPLRSPLASVAPAQPTVAVGDRVVVGQLVGEIPEGRLGARAHASIDGVVEQVVPGHHIAIAAPA